MARASSDLQDPLIGHPLPRKHGLVQMMLRYMSVIIKVIYPLADLLLHFGKTHVAIFYCTCKTL